jgi:hypothetical protein
LTKAALIDKSTSSNDMQEIIEKFLEFASMIIVSTEIAIITIMMALKFRITCENNLPSSSKRTHFRTFAMFYIRSYFTGRPVSWKLTAILPQAPAIFYSLSYRHLVKMVNKQSAIHSVLTFIPTT